MYKEKEKNNALGLALAFMLTSARFHDMCCFTCTYAYVRACVTSEKQGFYASTHAWQALSKVRAWE